MTDYSQILSYMRPELSMIAIICIVFIYDLFASEKWRGYMQPLTCLLLLVHIGVNIVPPSKESIDILGQIYRYTPMSSIIKSILTAGTLIVFMQSDTWLRREDTHLKRGEFYLLTLFTLLGMFFMISSANFMMFIIGLELATIPMACLVAIDKYRHHSAEAGAKYILSAMFSSGLMMYGLSFIYGTTGTLYFADIPEKLTGTPLQIMALVFFFSGMGFKISLVPFHLWTADVYEGAPTNVTAYLSTISKGAATFVLMTILIKVFAPMIDAWQHALYWVTIASITVANIFAIRQKNLKRFFAFSSISQAGYLMLGIIGGDAAGVTSMVYYILIYLAANLIIFGIISIIEQRSSGKTSIDDYNGLYKTNPKLTLAMTLALFSLAGIPPFAGFFSKFFIFATAFSAGFKILVFVALINTIVSLYYYLLVVKAMYITPSDNPIGTFRSDNYTRASLIICLAAIILIGLIGGIYNTLTQYTG